MKDVLLYCDEGVGSNSYKLTLKGLVEELDPSRYTIRTVDHQYFTTSSWEIKTALVVIPGGRDIPYHLKLQGAGNSRLSQYVSEGGTYLGICAGAYYGSAAIEFEKGAPKEIVATRELAFFPGKAIGPVYGSCALEAPIKWQGEDKITPLYFNGGCYFAHAEKYSNVSILAHYADVDKAAIVKCQIGKGQAILSGIHPEFTTEEDSSRLVFWKQFLNKILI